MHARNSRNFFRLAAAMLGASGLLATAGASDLLAQPPVPRSPAERAADEPGFLGLIGDDRREGGRGVRVRKVDRDSPADQASLKEGDLVFKINDQPIRNGQDMRRVLARMPAGTKVIFHIDRDGSTKEREVTLGERPPRERREHDFGPLAEQLPPPGEFPTLPAPRPSRDHAGVRDEAAAVPSADAEPALPDPATPARAFLGLRTVPATDLDRVQHGVVEKQGAAVVMAITAGSPAHLAEIPLEAVIVAIDGKTIGGPTDLARRIATYDPGQEIELSYYFKRELVRRRLVLADATAEIVNRLPEGNAGVPRGKANPPAARPAPSVDSERVADLEREVATLSQRVADLEKVIDELRRREAK